MNYRKVRKAYCRRFGVHIFITLLKGDKKMIKASKKATAIRINDKNKAEVIKCCDEHIPWGLYPCPRMKYWQRQNKGDFAPVFNKLCYSDV